MTIIRPAIFPDDAVSLVDIWREFIATSPVDLTYQNNDRELEDLPGKYAAPGGCVLLADRNGVVEGCIALRNVSAQVCEMKRLYVRPHARGQAIGYQLVERLIAMAQGMGYREMRLDVQAQSIAARKLYDDFGFVTAPPVSFNPIPGAAFLGRRL